MTIHITIQVKEEDLKEIDMAVDGLRDEIHQMVVGRLDDQVDSIVRSFIEGKNDNKSNG